MSFDDYEPTFLERFGTTDAGWEERILDAEMAAGEHADWDDYDEDRRQDAKMEEWDDRHPPDMTCEECGCQWWGNWSRGSRIDPPEPRHPDCPNCGS